MGSARGAAKGAEALPVERDILGTPTFQRLPIEVERMDAAYGSGVRQARRLPLLNRANRRAGAAAN
jgi:hypothetical protein